MGCISRLFVLSRAVDQTVERGHYSRIREHPHLPRVAPVSATGVEKGHYLMSADLPPDIKKRHFLIN